MGILMPDEPASIIHSVKLPMGYQMLFVLQLAKILSRSSKQLKLGLLT